MTNIFAWTISAMFAIESVIHIHEPTIALTLLGLAWLITRTTIRDKA